MPTVLLNLNLRLSVVVTVLVVSLTSCSTAAFGTSTHSQLLRAFGTIKGKAGTPTFGRCISRGGSSHASLLSEDAVVAANLSLLSERGRAALTKLIDSDDGSQKHVYTNWPEPGIDDDGKRQLAEQVILAVKS